jgi:polyisoprenoid-binding protein YceI
MNLVTCIFSCCLIAFAITTANPASADDYTIDASHSAAIFKAPHRDAGSVFGMMPAISGTLHIDAANPGKNSVSVVVRPSSLTTFQAKRDDHLKSPDFFNAKEFSEIKYQSKSWKKTSESTYQVIGDLTIIGVTKEVTTEIKHTGTFTNEKGQTATGYETMFEIDRTDFGMNFGVAKAGGIGKIIEITFSIECQKK